MFSIFAFKLSSISLIIFILAFFQLFTHSTSSPASSSSSSTSLQNSRSGESTATEQCIENCLYPLVFLTKSLPTTEKKDVIDLCTSLDNMKRCLQGCSLGAETLPTMARLVLYSYFIMNQLCHTKGITEPLMLESSQEKPNENKPDVCLRSCEKNVRRAIVEGGSTLQDSEICHIWTNYEQCAFDCPAGAEILDNVMGEKAQMFEEIENFCSNDHSEGSTRRRMLQSYEGPKVVDAEDADQNQNVDDVMQKIAEVMKVGTVTATNAEDDSAECHSSCQQTGQNPEDETPEPSAGSACQIWADYKQCVYDCPEGEEILANVETANMQIFEEIEDFCSTSPPVGSMRRRMLQSYEAPDSYDAEGIEESPTVADTMVTEKSDDNDKSNENVRSPGGISGTTVTTTSSENVPQKDAVGTGGKSKIIDTTPSSEAASSTLKFNNVHNTTISYKYPKNITNHEGVQHDPGLPAKKALKTDDKLPNKVSIYGYNRAVLMGCLIAVLATML